MTIITAVAVGDKRLRPDHRVVVVESDLGGGIWGCDFLENADGHPDPVGTPACYGLALREADIASYQIIS